MNSNLSHQPQAHKRLHTGFLASDATSSASRTSYICMTHPETVSNSMQECTQCGATLIPTHQAIAHAAMALRSLSAVTRALRLHPV